MSGPAVLDAAGRIADALDAAGFDYALAGAIALAYWTVPRATVAIDVTVAADTPRLPELLRALGEAGCEIEEERAFAAAERGDFGARIDGIRVDVFLPVLELSDDAHARRVRVPFGDRQVFVLSPEDLALFNTIFARTKDWADLERLLATRGATLDRAYLEKWLGRLFSQDDERARRFRTLLDAAAGTVDSQ